MFQTQEVEAVNARHKDNIHRPVAMLTAYEEGAYYVTIKLYKPPLSIKCSSTNSKQLKTSLKEFLLTYTFYFVDEFILLRNY